METTTGLRDFLDLPYDKLEEMNLEAKQQRLDHVEPEKIKGDRVRYLQSEKRIKAVTVCFTDLEGRLHMLDYDKKFLLKSLENLTFDGSSIRGFSQQAESDLRLGVDWSSFRATSSGRARSSSSATSSGATAPPTTPTCAAS